MAGAGFFALHFHGLNMFLNLNLNFRLARGEEADVDMERDLTFDVVVVVCIAALALLDLCRPTVGTSSCVGCGVRSGDTATGEVGGSGESVEESDRFCGAKVVSFGNVVSREFGVVLV